MFDALLPGEHPHVVILAGAAGSAIVATGERILVIKTGRPLGGDARAPARRPSSTRP